MCGLFGVFYTDPHRTVEVEKLKLSAADLSHRGPDARAYYAGQGIGLAHTRLSFLDLDPRSDQPFWDHSGRYAIVFNGEIYNFVELRARLAERGVECRTTSDTEVLLYCLIHWEAETILPELRGMFAFAFYDSVEDSLLLARDRFGMKPLYVREEADMLLFASEVKALRPWREPRIDQFSVASYLLKFRGPTRGATFFESVQSVSPGSMIHKRRGEPSRVATYATLEHMLDASKLNELRSFTTTQIVDQLDDLLTQSVKSHMFADVPVGAFCSGGVDSSLLMAMAARMHNNLAIFHSNVKGPWSEYDAALALSKHLKLDLKTVDVDEHHFVDHLPRVMKHYEQPYADRPNCIPLMMVAQLARDSGVKGLLSGEGSDECFLGYPWLGRKRLTDAFGRGTDRLRSLIRRVPALGPALWPDEGHYADATRTLLNRREIADDDGRIRSAVAAIHGADVSRHSQWTLEYLHHHLRVLLHRNDTMGMAASIEARFPFLDIPVVEAAVNMPPHFKLRVSAAFTDKAHPFVRDKWVVRKVADRYIPRSLSQRPKFGFWTTVFQRLTVSPNFFTDSYLGSVLGLTDRQMHDTIRATDQEFQLRLLHLDVWGKMMVQGSSEEAVVTMLRDHVRIKPL